jgi:phosphatidylglycerophosphate synthase
MEKLRPEHRVVNDFLIPCVLLTSAGLFSWAIRGQSGFGAVPGCVFAGVLWALIWFLLSREPTEKKQRRYSSGWVVLALIVGIGVSGMQGWGQWTPWMRGNFVIDFGTNTYVPVNPALGFTGWFLAGLHWSGIGAIMLAWTGSKNPLTPTDWAKRIIFGAGGVLIALMLFYLFPQWFLPYYHETGGYDPTQCAQCSEVYGDNLQLALFTGAYIGFLLYEVSRKDWTNVKLILIVGIVNGLLWAFLQYFWSIWVPTTYPNVPFNWWRCFESTSGGAIGFSLAIAYYFCNGKLSDNDLHQRAQPYSKARNLEKILGIEGALIIGFAWSMMQGIKGWLHIVFPENEMLDSTLWGWALPIATLFGLIWAVLIYETIRNPFLPNDERDNGEQFPKYFVIIYFTHRVLGLQVTLAPEYSFSERFFFVYYIILALIDWLVIWIYSNRIQRNNQ